MQDTSANCSVERDKAKEDVVAKLFETVVGDLKLPPLKRISQRTELEEAVCTAALVGGTSQRYLSQFYETTNPESSLDEVKRIVIARDFTVKRKGKTVPWFARYSVAVWRVNAGLQHTTYWVGLGFYESAATEFIDCHFTDDVHYCGLWKKSIAPRCRRK